MRRIASPDSRPIVGKATGAGEPATHVVQFDYTPHQWQQRIHWLMARHRFVVSVCHRRFGKTRMSIASLIQSALSCERPDPRLAYVAPRLKQAKQVSWLYLRAMAARVPGTRVNESELFVEFPNRARITLYGGSEGNEEAMRGLYLDGAIVDEVSGMKPSTWSEIMRPTLADRKGWACFIGTPKGIDFFHELYHAAIEREGWGTALYRADEVELPWLPPEELAAARLEMGELAYRQEFLCDFSVAAANALITIDIAAEAAARSYNESEYGWAPLILGVDVARFGDDRSCIAIRQGLRLHELLVFDEIDNMSLAGRVAEEITKWSADGVFVDAGRGEGVIDRLRQMGHRVYEVNFGGKPRDEHYQDKRTEMWMDTKTWLEQGGWIPNNAELKTDLCGPQYEFMASGKVRLESKDKMKDRGLRSTDLADAVALTFAEPVNPRLSGRHRAETAIL